MNRTIRKFSSLCVTPAHLSKGKLIILITKKTRDEAYFYVSKSREKKMHSAIDQIKGDLARGKTFTRQRTLD